MGKLIEYLMSVDIVAVDKLLMMNIIIIYLNRHSVNTDDTSSEKSFNF